MKIIIKTEDEIGTKDLIIDNDLNNPNYISMHINEVEYLVPLDDLLAALNAFKDLQYEARG
jgi:hypothetical protein